MLNEPLQDPVSSLQQLNFPALQYITRPCSKHVLVTFAEYPLATRVNSACVQGAPGIFGFFGLASATLGNAIAIDTIAATVASNRRRGVVMIELPFLVPAPDVFVSAIQTSTGAKTKSGH